MEPDYDVLVIGSGFGGSVTALRLTEKGYRVGVLEAGRRFADEEFAETSWNLRKFLWAPRLGCYGIQRIHLLRNVMILAGAGVGGGSLNYANTLYVPPEPFFNDQQWSHITDWRAELMPHYEQAKRMLGVVTNPTFTDADRIMKEVADDMGVGDTFVPTPVGVFFGPDGAKTPGKRVPDPYFGGAGPARTGCIECGSCMTGCRYGAKNTLVKNYLGLAESAGAQVHPMTTVTGFKQRPDGAVGGRHRPNRTDVATQAKDVHRHAPGARGRHVRHAEAALQDARRRHAAEVVGQTGRADPHQLRVDRRRGAAGGRTRPGPHPRRGHHLVDPPDRRHPRRTGALRQGFQRDGAAADADDRRHRTRRAPTCRGGASCSTRPARTRRRCCGCSTRSSGASAP